MGGASRSFRPTDWSAAERGSAHRTLGPLDLETYDRPTFTAATTEDEKRGAAGDEAGHAPHLSCGMSNPICVAFVYQASCDGYAFHVHGG